MPEGTTGSTVPRRQLGRYLREMRNRARLTVKAAATKLEWSEAKIWRIETGQTSLRSLDVEAMCKIYGAPADVTEGLMGLAKETKARGWWHAYGDVIPEWLEVYVGLEEAASRLSMYESELVPGLLQTEDYARTVIAADNPGVDDAEIERRVHVRIERQALLTRVTAPPQVEVALNEAVLRRPVGGREVMAAQLHRPGSRRRPLQRVGADRAFQRRSTPWADVRPVQHPPVSRQRRWTGDRAANRVCGGLHWGAIPGKPNEIERYSAAFERIWVATLDETTSKNMIIQAARDL